MRETSDPPTEAKHRAQDDVAVLSLRGVGKTFGSTVAASGISFDLPGGQVVALVGENGAGKSTCVNMLGGVFRPDEGEVRFAGGPVVLHSPLDAQRLGIAVVHQHPGLFGEMSIAENIFAGNLRRNQLGLVDHAGMRREATQWLTKLGLRRDPATPVSNLRTSEQQMVEIARALAAEAKVLILDEPTAALSTGEVAALFTVIRQLRSEGVAIMFVGHRLEEIRAIADQLVILRDGRLIDSGAMADHTDRQLNELIAGRELAVAMAGRPAAIGAADAPVLELRNLSTARLSNIDLSVAAGEIVGLAGLVGSGRSAIMRSVFGVDARTGGEIRIGGKTVEITAPKAAMAAGIALIPEDRRGHAIVPMMSIEQNFGLASQRRFARFGALRGAARRAEIRRYVADLQIRPANIATPMANLSGGNQQKVVIARWLATGARVLMFDEPTRGVDVGAKAEIYALLRRLAADGAAVLMISSELPELLLLSHRIGIVNRGRLTQVMENSSDLNEDILMRHASAGGAP